MAVAGVENNGHKVGKRPDSTILPGRNSRACAGGRTGNQQPAHVSDRRKGGLRLSESPDAVFNVDTDSEIAFGIENEARPVKELEERVEQTTKDLHIESYGTAIF